MSRRRISAKACLLLRKWENSQKLVVFDFGEIEEPTDAVHFGEPVLWATYPGRQKGETVMRPIYRARFLDAMIKGEDLIGVKVDVPPVRVPNFTAPMSGQPRRRPRRNWRL